MDIKYHVIIWIFSAKLSSYNSSNVCLWMALSVDCIVIEFCLYIYKPCGCLKKLSVYAKLVYLNVFIEIDFLADQQDDVFF